MLWSILVTAVVAGLALVGPDAMASSAQMQDGHLVYLADEGEANALTIEPAGDGLLTVTDTGAVIRASDGCVPREPHVAECGHTEVPEFGDLHWHSIDVGDRADTVRTLAVGEIAYVVQGGAGDDLLLGSEGRDFLAGGEGDDRLEGAGGDDGFGGGPGADLMRGGPGTDHASYQERTAGVRVSIGDGPGDGEPGEGDDVQTEDVWGGAGDDVLVGNDVANELVGATGADVLDGRGGPDELHGVDYPSPEPAPAADRMRCGSGTDGAEPSGPDVVADDCEHLVPATVPRLSVLELERTSGRRIRATVGRPHATADSVATAQLWVPCGPLRADGTRCWRRIGRTRASTTIARGREATLRIVLSRAGRARLARRPRERVRLTVVAREPDLPDRPVELRLRLRVGRVP